MLQQLGIGSVFNVVARMKEQACHRWICWPYSWPCPITATSFH